MAKLIASRYANALFELGQDSVCLDKLFDDAILLKDIFQMEKDFIKIMISPRISSEDKINMIVDIFDGKISDNFIGLFSLIFNKNRGSEIISILSEFIKQVEVLRNISVADIISPVELSPEQLNKISDAISQKINKQIKVETKIDSSLIGGFCIKIEGKIIDYSIKKQINDMKKYLKDLQLVN